MYFFKQTCFDFGKAALCLLILVQPISGSELALCSIQHDIPPALLVLLSTKQSGALQSIHIAVLTNHVSFKPTCDLQSPWQRPYVERKVGRGSNLFYLLICKDNPRVMTRVLDGRATSAYLQYVFCLDDNQNYELFQTSKNEQEMVFWVHLIPFSICTGFSILCRQFYLLIFLLHSTKILPFRYVLLHYWYSLYWLIFARIFRYGCFSNISKTSLN